MCAGANMCARAGVRVCVCVWLLGIFSTTFIVGRTNIRNTKANIEKKNKTPGNFQQNGQHKNR